MANEQDDELQDDKLSEFEVAFWSVFQNNTDSLTELSGYLKENSEIFGGWEGSNGQNFNDELIEAIEERAARMRGVLDEKPRF